METETYSISQAAKKLGIGRSTLWRSMKDGKAPPHFRIGKRVLFPIDQFNAWKEAKANENH